MPSSPASSQPPDYVSQPVDTDDEDGFGNRRGSSPVRKKGVYDSRIEQILYENPDLPILITHAGKNHEGGGSYIVYTIRTGVSLHLVYIDPAASSRIGKGYRSSPTVFGVRFSTTSLGELAPDVGNPAYSRETHHGRLCCQADEGEGGHGHH